jgi:hypothetical protein
LAKTIVDQFADTLAAGLALAAQPPDLEKARQALGYVVRSCTSSVNFHPVR